MPFIEMRRSQMYYEEYGDGPAILLAHGVGGNHASWFRQIPTFSRNFRVIPFDFRGFGNSTDVERLGRDAYIDDIKCLLDSLEIDQAILLGQSMGAGAVAAFTCQNPSRVSALVHCDSLTGVRLEEPYAAELAAQSEKAKTLSRIERVLGQTTIANDPESSLLYLQIASFNSVNFKTITGTAASWSPSELTATAVPVLFVAGEEDALFPPRLIQKVHEYVPGSSYKLIPAAGHSAYFEQAQTFNREVLDFLKAFLV